MPRDPRARAEWLTDKYILALLLLFPLFTGFQGYREITAAKLAFYLAATALWLAGLGWCLLAGLRPRFREWGAFLWVLVAFLLWCAVSALCSPFGSTTLWGAGRYDGLLPQLCYGVTAIGVYRLARPRRRYVWAMGVSVLLCCAVALLQLAGGNPLGLYPHGWRFADAGIRYSGMYLGTVGNTLILGAVLALCVPVLVYTALRRRGRELWLLLPAALALFLLWRSECSSAVVGLLGSTALTLPRCFSRRRRKWVWLAEGLLALAALAVVYAWPRDTGTVYELSRLLHGEAADSFGSSRVRIWRAVWEAFRARPVLGGGPGTVAARIDVTFSRFVPETGCTLSAYTTNAHNEYLGYLANLGFPGLGLYLLAMGLTLFTRRPGWEALLWGVTAYWIQGFFGLGLCLSAPMLWVIWGLYMSQPPERVP